MASGAVGAVVGALIGWASSLTQVHRPVLWLWILVGGVLGAGACLLLWNRIYVKRHAPTTPSVGDEVVDQLRDYGLRQEKIAILTALLREANRLLATFESAGGDWEENHPVPEWITRCDYSIWREFGPPSDALARSHDFRPAPPHLPTTARWVWQDADRRRGWIIDKLREMENQ